MHCGWLWKDYILREDWDCKREAEHLQKCHTEVWASIQEEERLLTLTSQQMKVDNRKTETEKGTLKIYNLRTSKEREKFLSRVGPLVI